MHTAIARYIVDAVGISDAVAVAVGHSKCDANSPTPMSAEASWPRATLYRWAEAAAIGPIVNAAVGAPDEAGMTSNGVICVSRREDKTRLSKRVVREERDGREYTVVGTRAPCEGVLKVATRRRRVCS